MKTELQRVEDHLRSGEALDTASTIVIRGWPLTVEGLRRNAEATSQRYSFDGDPFIAVSAEATVAGWTKDAILSGSRLRTRRSYAQAMAGDILGAGFELLPTFVAPHYSIRLQTYTDDELEHLIAVLGEIHSNPHFTRRRS